jgi:Protein of unknown function (DUF3617)
MRRLLLSRLPSSRLPLSRLAAALLLCSVSGLAASAMELPTRKAGLWEIKMMRTGGPMPEMTMQHCTDETTDKQMTSTLSPMSKDICSKNDTAQTANGYTIDSVCSTGGMAMTSHADVTGDFNSAYAVKVTSHSQGGPAGAARDSSMTLEAKWLGACKADQKAGDIVMPGGLKMNIHDIDKLKGLFSTKPKQ